MMGQRRGRIEHPPYPPMGLPVLDYCRTLAEADELAEAEADRGRNVIVAPARLRLGFEVFAASAIIAEHPHANYGAEPEDRTTWLDRADEHERRTAIGLEDKDYGGLERGKR